MVQLQVSMVYYRYPQIPEICDILEVRPKPAFFLLKNREQIETDN